VVALAGDFGVQFTLQELMTAVELDLTLPVVVWNNGALGQIRDDNACCGHRPIGVVARNPDFVASPAPVGPRAYGSTRRRPWPRRCVRLWAAGPTLLEAVAEDFS